MKKIPKKKRKEIAAMIRECRENPQAMVRLSQQFREMGYDGASRMIDQHYPDLFNYMAYPEAHWKKIRTTNLMENTNRQIKRRSRVVGAFPNDTSLTRLAITILMNIEEDWKAGHRLIDLYENPITTGPIIETTAKN